MSRPRLLELIVLALACTGLASCGGDSEEGTASAAAQLCRDYRDAVAEVRYQGTDEQQADDFTALADASKAAADGTEASDLDGDAGAKYLTTLEGLQGAYDDAAAAKADGDDEAFSRALDAAEPGDDALDGLAGDGGFDECALGEVSDDEQGVSQSGFPATAVPADAIPRPPTGDPGAETTVSYALNESEEIRLVRGPQLDTGTTDLDDAASRFEDQFEDEFASLDAGEDDGNELLPMRSYTYTFESGSQNGGGTIHVFSGQGNVWAIDCGSASSTEASDDLQAACDRAVDTAGFLMF